MTDFVSKFVKFKFSKFSHWENIPCKFLTLVVLKLDKSIDDNFRQLLNIFSIEVTEEVSKLFIINLSKFWHPLNIIFIFFTVLVLKLDKFIVFNFWQLLNIFSIVITEDVSKFFKSIFSKFILFENIYFIFSTFLVLKLDTFIDLILDKPWNIYSILLVLRVLISPKSI